MSRREHILNQIKKVARVYLPDQTKVFIFGSQANLLDLRNSDIDIGIQAPEKIELHNLWEFKEALNSTANLYTFDVVDFASVSDSFRVTALKEIEYVLND